MSTEVEQTTAGAHRDPDPTETMKAAKAPKGVSSAPTVAILIALAVAALGAVCVRDALVSWGVVSGTGWIAAVVDQSASVTSKSWMLPIFVLMVLAAIPLVLVALRPRRRRATRLKGSTGVYIRHRDLETLLERAARDTDGVESVNADVSGKRRVTLRVLSTAPAEDVDSVKSALTASTSTILDALAVNPQLTLKVTPAS